MYCNLYVSLLYASLFRTPTTSRQAPDSLFVLFHCSWKKIYKNIESNILCILLVLTHNLGLPLTLVSIYRENQWKQKNEKTKRKESLWPQNDLYTSVHSSLFVITKNWKQLKYQKQMHKQIIVYPYHRTPPSIKRN